MNTAGQHLTEYHKKLLKKEAKYEKQVKEQLKELFREGRTLQETNPNIGYEEAYNWLIEQAKNQSGADYFHFNVDWIETEE